MCFFSCPWTTCFWLQSDQVCLISYFGRCPCLFRPAHIIAHAGWTQSTATSAVAPFTAARSPTFRQSSSSEQTPRGASPRRNPSCMCPRLWRSPCGATTPSWPSVCLSGGRTQSARWSGTRFGGEQAPSKRAGCTTPPRSLLLSGSWRRSARVTFVGLTNHASP